MQLPVSQGGTGDTFTTQELIRQECLFVSDFLIKKNQAYGNSFAEPVQIFSRSNPLEQLNVRIDDKIKRLLNKDVKAKRRVKEDTELDLIGYLILRRVMKRMLREEKKDA